MHTSTTFDETFLYRSFVRYLSTEIILGDVFENQIFGYFTLLSLHVSSSNFYFTQSAFYVYDDNTVLNVEYLS